ncbi:MAG: hypothetical protein WCI92_06500 [Bacteroidota bacterium]
MDLHPDNINTVHFPEYNFVKPNQANATVLDIILEGEISSNAYCLAIFRKVLTIGLSEIVDFIDYHCEILKSPICWLNSLEKLIRLNQSWFNDDDQKFRPIKWGSEIISKRHEIKAASMQNARQKKLSEAMNGFTGDKVYCFDTVKEAIRTMEIAEEKILYLRTQIKDYKQNPPEFESNRKPKFDEQCQVEINGIIEEEELLQKVLVKRSSKKQNLSIDPKGKIYCNTNAFLDIFFQLTTELKIGQNPLLSISTADLAEIICQNFSDKEGNPISRFTILTILDPNRPDKRPKTPRRYKVNGINE